MAGDRFERNAARLDQPREVRRPLLRRPTYDAETFGRASERFARFMGTAQFLVFMTAFIILWIGWNAFGPPRLRFDPYAFLFLTLMLSLQASYAAPLILLAQNRQTDRDRVGLEQDRARDERNLADTEYLTREVAALRIALRDVATRDFVRSELRSMLDDLEERGMEVTVRPLDPLRVSEGAAGPSPSSASSPSTPSSVSTPSSAGQGRPTGTPSPSSGAGARPT